MLGSKNVSQVWQGCQQTCAIVSQVCQGCQQTGAIVSQGWQGCQQAGVDHGQSGVARLPADVLTMVSQV